MKIAVDTWTLAPRFRHQGTYIYASNLISEFRKAAERCRSLEFCAFAPSEGPENALALEPGPGFSVVRSRFFDHERIWRICGASLAGVRVRADLMFSPSCNIVPLNAPPMVCTIHDVTPIVMPSHSRQIVLAQKFFLHSAARRSRAIITVSECSRQDLIERCGVQEDKVTVVYNGYDRQFFNDASAEPGKLQLLCKRLGIARHYVFHHGVVQPRKNLKRLIEAWKLLLARRHDLNLDLVLVGPLGWRHEEVSAAGRECSSARGNVVVTGELSSGNLAQVLKGAALVVVPSLYEGFCLPMVEAMACGVPTIVSDNSCFREISGDGLVYFDPLEIEDIAVKMDSALFDSGLRTEIAKRGLQRTRDFSWERCGRETLEVLFRAAGHEWGRETRE